MPHINKRKKNAPPNTSSGVSVMVSVSGEHIAQIETVADRLRTAGMQINNILASVGVITGLVDAPAIPAMREVEGVQDIEVQKDIELPPPDAPVQ